MYTLYQLKLKRYETRSRNEYKTGDYRITKKLYERVGGEYTRTNQQPDAKEAKQICSKIWEKKEHIKNSEWINYTEKQLHEGREEDIHLEYQHRKKYRIHKHLAMDFGLKIQVHL